MTNTILLTPPEVAERLRLSVSALKQWRLKGIGPTYLKLGARVFYTPEALGEYLASTTRTKTRDSEPS